MSDLNSPDLMDQLEQFLEETYAVQCAFAEYPLEKVGHMLEDARESFENVEEPSPEFLTEKASYERCVEIYCNLLMAIESLNKPMPDETLGELSGRQQRTQVFQSPSMKKDKAIPTPPPLMNRIIPPALKLNEPEEEIEVSTEEDPLEGMGLDTPPEMLGGLNENDEAPASPQEAGGDIWAVTPVAPAPNPEERLEELPEISISAMTEELDPPLVPQNKKTLFEEEAAPAPSAILEEPAIEEWKEKPLAASTPSHTFPPAPTALISNLAQDYWQQAEFFRGQLKAGTWPLPQPLLIKLIGQSLCFSLESEVGERLFGALKVFWMKRESAIRTLLDNGNRKFELHPTLKKAIDHAAEEHTEWLLEGKFPHAAVLSSLRYMIATLQPDKFEPSLLEGGIFIFFFGQNGSADVFPLQNMLGVSGLDFNHATEFFFRLSRLHRLKNKFLSPTGVLELGQLLILEQDFETVVRLMESLQIDPGVLKEVA